MQRIFCDEETLHDAMQRKRALHHKRVAQLAAVPPIVVR